MKSHLKLASVLIVAFFLMKSAFGLAVSPLPPGAQNAAVNPCRNIYQHLARLNECPPDTECVEVDGLIVDRVRIEDESRCRIRLGEVGEEGNFVGTFSGLTAVHQNGDDYSFYYVIHNEEEFLSFDHYELELVSGEVLRVVFTNVRDRASPARMAGGRRIGDAEREAFEEVAAREDEGRGDDNEGRIIPRRFAPPLPDDLPENDGEEAERNAFVPNIKIPEEFAERLQAAINQAKAQGQQNPGDADIPIVDANPVQPNGCSLMAKAKGQAGNSLAILFGFLGITLTGLRSRVNRSKVRQSH